MTTGIFITGTDTGVGKTVAAAGIVRLLARQGHRVAGLTPIASGAELTPVGLRNDDALALAAAGSAQNDRQESQEPPQDQQHPQRDPEPAIGGPAQGPQGLTGATGARGAER